MKPISSAITGALRQVETQQSSIGEQRGETGSGLALTDAEARARLAQPPEETDRKLAQWLKSSLGGELTKIRENRYPQDQPAYSVLAAVRVRDLSPASKSKALAAYRAAMTPPKLEQVEGWLAMLHTATAHRSEGEATLSIAIDLYASALAQYPADVAKQACMNLATRRVAPNWWPTLSELLMEADDLVAERKAILAELERPEVLMPPREEILELQGPPVREMSRKEMAAAFRKLAASLG